MFERIKGVFNNIFSTSILFFIGLVTIGLLVFVAFMTKDRLTNDSVVRSKVHKLMLKESSWDYVTSLLLQEYSQKERENTIASASIVREVDEVFKNDSAKLVEDFDKAVLGETSIISNLIRTQIDPYGDKIVFFRHGSKLYPLDDVTKGTEISIYKGNDHKEYSDIAKAILKNTSPTFESFEQYIYDYYGKDTRELDIDSLKQRFLDGTYEVNDLSGILLCATYINWKRGLLGDKVELYDGRVNPDVRQLIVLTKIDIVKTLSSNPTVIKHLGNFNRNSKIVDSTFDAYDSYHIIILLISSFLIFLIGITILVQYDLNSIRKANKRRRVNDRTFGGNHIEVTDDIH